jgi:hypothetical protein
MSHTEERKASEYAQTQVSLIISEGEINPRNCCLKYFSITLVYALERLNVEHLVHEQLMVSNLVITL